MTQFEIQEEMVTLLERIGILVNEDLKEVSTNISSEQTISYIFFIRIAEIYKAISVLLGVSLDQTVSAQILLRSLCEYYIQLKASFKDPLFNSRHIKASGTMKSNWLNKVIKHKDESGFVQDKSFFEKLKLETEEAFKEHEKSLQNVNQLFEEHAEMLLYLGVYTSATMYVHGDRQSFHIYEDKEERVRPTTQRDYSSLLITSGISSAKIMADSYSLFCKEMNIQSKVDEEIKELISKSAKKLNELQNLKDPKDVLKTD